MQPSIDRMENFKPVAVSRAVRGSHVSIPIHLGFSLVAYISGAVNESENIVFFIDFKPLYQFRTSDQQESFSSSMEKMRLIYINSGRIVVGERGVSQDCRLGGGSW